MALPAAAEDNCKDILANGIWEYQSGASDTHNVSAFLNWYGSVNAGSSSETKKQSLNGSAMYEGVPFSLGLSNDEQKSNEFFAKLEKLNAGYDEYDSEVEEFVSKASVVVTKAWSDCMSAQGAGVRASLKFTENPRDLILDFRYLPINAQTTSASISLDVPPSIKCGKKSVSVSLAGAALRCTRLCGDPGTILLNSDTVISPDKSLRFFGTLIRTSLAGKPYAKCDVIEEVSNGKVNLGPEEKLEPSGTDIGGTHTSATLTLEAPEGYQLTNVQAHCVKLDDSNNPCAFVRGLEVTPASWVIPSRMVQVSVSTDSGRVSVSLTGTKQKVISGVDRVKHPEQLQLSYGKPFSVEFPKNALDVKLYCSSEGTQRIFSMSDVEREGDQIYLRASHDGVTSRIIDLAVAPFDLAEKTTCP